MVPTALASEMTTVIRDFGTGVEKRIARDIQVPATQVLSMITFALRTSSSVLDFDNRRPKPRARGDYAIVDRHLTRC